MKTIEKLGAYILSVSLIFQGTPVWGSNHEKVMSQKADQSKHLEMQHVRSDFRVPITADYLKSQGTFYTTPATLLLQRLLHVNGDQNQMKTKAEAAVKDFMKQTYGMKAEIVRQDLWNSLAVSGYPIKKDLYTRTVDKYKGKDVGDKEVKEIVSTIRQELALDTGALLDGGDINPNIIIGITGLGFMLMYSAILVDDSAVLYTGLGVSTMAAWLGAMVLWGEEH
jgi:hypothetical protein